MSRNVIPADDGYTRPGYIEAVERLHDSLEFTYRPMIPEEVDAVDEVVMKKPAREGNSVVRAAIQQHLVSWSEVDEKGEPLRINLQNIRRLPWPVFNRLYKIICGQLPSDPVPDASPAEEDDYVRDLVEAAGSGKTPGQVTDEVDLKN
jgi:hypothetical protein